MSQGYTKDAVMQLTYPQALEKAKQGWLMSRRAWRNEYVFLAIGGTFNAYDHTTGQLQPFLVKKNDEGRHMPWYPSDADMLAEDWAAITRQSADRIGSE